MNRLSISLLLLMLGTMLSAQSVGIGTPAPHASAAMEISSTTQGMLVPRMSTGQRNQINEPAQGLLVFDVTSNSFWFRNTNSWVELVDSVNTEVYRNGPDIIYMGMTDSVGIGTITPEHKLQLFTPDERYGISHTNGNVDMATYVSAVNGGFIGTKSDHPFSLYAGDGIFQLLLLPNGKVGIGHPAPHGRLQFSNLVENKKIVLYDVGVNEHQFFGFGINIEGALRYQTPIPQNDHVFFSGSSATTSKELMRIAGSGEVMIGTSTPAIGHLLSVKGKIAAEEILVDLAMDWPDYVFEKNYSLTPLREVESFIARNGHLPDVPSAAEVAEKGIQLGEMNAVLLRKIEELTLYLLEQEKRIHQLYDLVNKKD